MHRHARARGSVTYRPARPWRATSPAVMQMRSQPAHGVWPSCSRHRGPAAIVGVRQGMRRPEPLAPPGQANADTPATQCSAGSPAVRTYWNRSVSRARPSLRSAMVFCVLTVLMLEPSRLAISDTAMPLT